MLDRVFRGFGLNGKAVLPMVLGLGCGTMAVLGSRVLETRKERLLVILLLSLTIPCSAQLGVVLGMLAGLSAKVSILWMLSIFGSIFVVGSILKRIVPGEESPFVLEIPPLRRPSLENILQKVKMRIEWYLKEAVPLFILGTAILFVADRTGVIVYVEKALSPFIVTLLGLPAETTKSFIMGFLRRDYGAAGLFVMAKDGLLDPRQILVSVTAITLLVPCIAQCFMVVREQGWKMALGIFIFVSLYAFLFAGLLNYVVGTLRIL
jgi:Fe2+ transport system protein B